MPAVRLDEGLGDGQTEAGPSPAAVLAEHVEDALAVFVGDTGTVVGHGDLHPCRVFGGGPSRHADDAAVGRQPLGVLEHVCQDLAHEDVIEVQEGQVQVRVDRDLAGRQDPAQQGQCLVEQLAEVEAGWSELERAGLQAGHVEKVGHEPCQAVRLQFDELQQLSPIVRAQASIDLAQARYGGLDGGEWCPQVVRGGAHQGTTPTVDLLEQPCPQSLLAQLGAVDGQRRLVGERAEQAALMFHQLHVLEHQHADRSVADHQRHRHPPRSGLFQQSEGAGLAATRCHRRDVGRGQGLARARRDPQRRNAGVTLGQHQGRPAWSEHRLHRCHHVGQKLRQAEIADQCLRQLVQPFGLLGPAFRLLARAPQLGHHLGHHQHDDGIDGQCCPVLGRADRERVVRREEEEVVDDEAPQRAHHAGEDATDDDSHQSGQHEDQGGDGDAQVSPEGEQHSEERSQADQSQGDAPDRSLVRSLGIEPAWSDVRHRIPFFEASLSVPTPWRAPAMRGGDDREHG